MSDSMTVEYGSHTIDFTKAPAVSVLAVLGRGVTHLLGSEAASKVDAYFKRDPAKFTADAPKMADTEENRATLKAQFQQGFIDAIMAGTLGVSSRGPAVDPLEAEMESIARKQVLQVLRDNKTKVPKKADQKVKFADGSEYTVQELVERRIANPKFADAIKAEAQAELDKKAKAKAKVAKAVSGQGLADLL